jgi:hypothetical protein
VRLRNLSKDALDEFQAIFDLAVERSRRMTMEPRFAYSAAEAVREAQDFLNEQRTLQLWRQAA